VDAPRRLATTQCELPVLTNAREPRGNFFEPDMAHRDRTGWLGM
jgi:hypothetical protein